MESVHDEAARYGIERPELEHQQREEGNVTVISLTQESEQQWANYLRNVGLARIAMNGVDA